MIEVTGDLWEYDAACRVVTTNGVVRRDGRAVMGRGSARQAAERYPELPELLADRLRSDGNHVAFFPTIGVASFPTKNNWQDKSDLTLIRRSALELVALTDEMAFGQVVLPRPGCGAGGLTWDVVSRVLAKLLDDRFHVITYE